MAIEPVNERPLFPALIRVDQRGVGQWSVDMVRQLTTVFQQYGYRLNAALLEEMLAAEGGTIAEIDEAQTWTATQTFTPVQEFTVMPTVGGDAIVESGSNANGSWVKWADGTMDQWGFHFDTVDITSTGNVLSGFRNNSVGHTLPQAFVSTTGMVVVASNHFDSGVGTHVLDLNVNTLSYLTTEFRLIWTSEASQAAQDVAASWHAKGRWK